MQGRTSRLVALMTGVAVLVTPVVASLSASASTSWVAPANLDPGLARTGAVSVVVTGSTVAASAAAVHAVGGTDLRPLPIINGVVATVAATSLTRLAGAPGVVAVTANRHVQLTR